MSYMSYCRLRCVAHDLGEVQEQVGAIMELDPDERDPRDLEDARELLRVLRETVELFEELGVD